MFSEHVFIYIYIYIFVCTHIHISERLIDCSMDFFETESHYGYRTVKGICLPLPLKCWLRLDVCTTCNISNIYFAQHLS